MTKDNKTITHTRKQDKTGAMGFKTARRKCEDRTVL